MISSSKLSPNSPAQILGILIFWKIFLRKFVTTSKLDYETEALQTNERKKIIKTKIKEDMSQKKNSLKAKKEGKVGSIFGAGSKINVGYNDS